MSSATVAFVVGISTPAITPAELELYRVEHDMRADGFPEPQILEAVNYQRLALDWLRDGTGRDALIAVHPAATGGSPMPRAPTGVSGSGMSSAAHRMFCGASRIDGGLF